MSPWGARRFAARVFPAGPQLLGGAEVCHVSRRPPGSLMRRIVPLLIAFSGPALAAPVCPAPEAEELEFEPGGPVQVDADRADVSAEGHSEFSGGVTVRRGAQVLETEGATYDPQTGRVAVTGGARFRQPGLRVDAEALEYLPAEGLAVLERSEYELPRQPARGAAGRIEARDTGRIAMDDVLYTTCPGDDPDWLLKIKELRLYGDKGIGEAEQVSLRFLGVPLIYWPYLSFPISDQRKTGFLVPEFGQSERSGLEFRVPYYVNLAPNYDYTATPAWYSSRGLQLGNEFRYLTGGSGGELELDYLPSDDARDGDARSYLNFEHLTRFDSGWRFVADLEDVSDTEYFQDLGSGVAITSQTHLERTLEAQYTGDVWEITGRAQNFRTLDLSIPEDERPYARLPQLLAIGYWRDGTLGLDWRMRTEATNFSRDVGAEGFRFVVEPAASLPLEGPGYFFVPGASLRYVNYQLTDSVGVSSDSPDLAVPTASVDSGLLFERDISSGEFVQTLEPRLLYAWIPHRDQETLPLFDTGLPDFNYVQLFRPNRFVGADRLGDTNQLSVGVTSRLIESASGREFLTASLGKAWFFDEPQVSLPGEPPPDADSSPIVLELGLGLFKAWNADIGYQWDDTDAATRLAQFRVQYQPAPNRVMNLSYRYRPGLLEDVGASVGWPLSDRWSFVGAIEYSTRDAATVNRLLGVQYESCCWAIRLASAEQVSRRDGTTDSSYRLQVEFKGLAGLGSNAKAHFEGDILGYSVYD